MEKESFGKKLKRLWKWQHRYPIVPIIILFVLIVCAMFADLSWLGLPDVSIAPYGPNDMSLSDRLSPPFFMPEGSTEHILGTDNIGRDILSRMIYGPEFH